jgi:uncharacterized membrane protein
MKTLLSMTDFISQVLPGVGEMANSHPLLVHFPIALFIAFLVMDFVGWLFVKNELRTAAAWMLYLGTLGACATVVTGFWAASKVPHDEVVHEIMLRHKNYGLAVLSFGIVLSVWRILADTLFSRFGQFLQFLFALVMVGTMTLGADLGGLMVYKHGVGTTKTACSPQEPHLSGTVDAEEEAFSSLEEHHHETETETPPCGEDPVNAPHTHAHHTH